ncbi:probable arginine--tRNA ligase, mitochondrial isoform X2 [Homarus americanus]|uniref:probable arginine--tRNA ligase, mitochondrial isoform X2 n=1 Tax=Homarus americanus TaxID=6706 RepID=UPI001C488838|nr:probable arginine--tRNA ligase, mitochondrial isoform X2 [Homarus americanus]
MLNGSIGTSPQTLFTPYNPYKPHKKLQPLIHIHVELITNTVMINLLTLIELLNEIVCCHPRQGSGVSALLPPHSHTALLPLCHHQLILQSQSQWSRVNNSQLVSEVVKITTHRPNSFWRCSALVNLLPFQKVVVEYSSPNIAKPFHIGHLRSTIIGNFIANLHAALGHNVTRINYLGDWGTQFGILKYGYDARNITEKDLEEDAIKKLYEVYVWANQKAESDPSVSSKARDIFNKMEQGDNRELETWEFFRNVSIKEFKHVYERLNVKFDEYHGESMYSAQKCQEVLKLLEQKNLLQTLEDGRKVYEVNPKQKVTVVKSDGSSIYLSRDIAAAIHRQEEYKFTKMYYVVDNSQSDHFVALFSIIRNLGFEWAESMTHIKFGRIQGMSTRKGTAIFLQDLLDEAQEIMMQKQQETETTRDDVRLSGAETAGRVATSCVLIGDMKQRRQRDYVFSWDKALQSRGDTGVKLQYVHCRLLSLEGNCGVDYNPEANTSCLTEPQALTLIMEIARFDEVLVQTYRELEPCILVSYLFKLCGTINNAIKLLQVKSAPLEVAEARLALFMAARHTLAAGMNILGVKPLSKIADHPRRLDNYFHGSSRQVK